MAATDYEVLYGGAAGGGKTDALLYLPVTHMHRPSMRALFLRRTYPELREAMDRALTTFRRFGATWSASERRWRFPSGATYEFGYCTTFQDATRYQGQEYGIICYDELGHVAEERVWTFLISRNRSTDADAPKLMRASANPGGPGHGWIKRRFLDQTGEDRRYVPARLADNPTLDLHDPGYRARLEMLPDVTRRQLLDGDWSTAEGMALSELSERVHVVPVFAAPDRWYHWGALDWGYNHPWCAVWLAADDDGNAWLVDTVFGRRQLPQEIAERIQETFPVHLFRKFHAGHDCWAEVRARGEWTPSIAEQMASSGVRLQRANISRRAGLNNLRAYLHVDPRTQAPRFRIMDTPGNRRLYDCLASMVLDPDDSEDVLKVDANDSGAGGDDAYDTLRYGLAARPLEGQPAPEPPFRAFSREALQAELEHKRIFQHRRKKAKTRPTPDDIF